MTLPAAPHSTEAPKTRESRPVNAVLHVSSPSETAARPGGCPIMLATILPCLHKAPVVVPTSETDVGAQLMPVRSLSMFGSGFQAFEDAL